MRRVQFLSFPLVSVAAALALVAPVRAADPLIATAAQPQSPTPAQPQSPTPAQPQNLTAAQPPNLIGAQPPTLNAPPPAAGTTRPAAAATIIELRFDRGLTAHERARILQAANEWNVALGGRVRLVPTETALDAPLDAPVAAFAGAGRPQIWNIIAYRGRSTIYRAHNDYTMATTSQPAPGRPGTVIVHIDEIGSSDIAAVMRHEFGHVLGLGHDAVPSLMSARFSPHDMKCIDRRTMETLAARLDEPLDRFRWCE